MFLIGLPKTELKERVLMIQAPIALTKETLKKTQKAKTSKAKQGVLSPLMPPAPVYQYVEPTKKERFKNELRWLFYLSLLLGAPGVFFIFVTKNHIDDLRRTRDLFHAEITLEAQIQAGHAIEENKKLTQRLKQKEAELEKLKSARKLTEPPTVKANAAIAAPTPTSPLQPIPRPQSGFGEEVI